MQPRRFKPDTRGSKGRGAQRVGLAGTVEGSVIDLERLRVTTTPRFTVAASGSGRVLRAAGGAYDFARGPLRWEALRWTEPSLARDPSPPR
jgi:hypothetical protein